MPEEEKSDDLIIEPVEVHPEMYSANLFGGAPEEVVNPRALTSEAGLRHDSDLPTSSGARRWQGGINFNIFSLTDALGARNKREAWLLYQKALASGLAPEEVFYKVQWQVKTLLTAQNTKSVAETDMKPYPYSKAKGYLKNFKANELESLSEALVLGYHSARRGQGDIETLVEKFLLKL